MDTISQVIASPKRASLVALALLLCSLSGFGLLFWLGQAHLFGFAYLGASVLVAGWLYASGSPAYLGFVLWSWFLASFVRRLVDYHLGVYTPPGGSLILLTPFAVTLLSILDIPRFGGLLTHRRFLPFLLALCAVLYGFLLSVPLLGPTEAAVALVNWTPPILIGFHILASWRSYPQLRRSALRAFIWGMLILGLYGIAQFFLAPGWDAFWMQNADMNSIGHPYPTEIRVFSMLDSPGPFAMVMLTGLILSLASMGPLSAIASVPGYISFLLCMVRGAWLGWGVALLALISRLKGRLRFRLIVFASLLALLIVPILVNTGSLGDVTASRMSTLGDVQNDGSFQARLNLFKYTLPTALANPIGHGLGSRSLDNGFIEVLWQLGWFGTVLYGTALFLMFKQAFRGKDHFALAAMAVALAFLFQMLAANQLAQVAGIIFWSMLSFATASGVYEDSKRKMENDPPPSTEEFSSLSSVPA